MLLDRTDDEEAITLPSATTRRTCLFLFSNFLQTSCCLVHGYDGIILEVSESSQVVAVMLF